MKIYPYSHIKSDNLKLLLYTARIIGALSIIFAVVAVFNSTIMFFSNDTTILSSGVVMTKLGNSSTATITLMWGGFSSLSMLAFSGFCAAIVSCEYKYTHNDNLTLD